MTPPKKTPRQLAEEQEKAIGQFRLQLNGVMEPFCGKVSYGQGVFVPQAINEIVKLALQLHERLGGKDIPITTTRRT